MTAILQVEYPGGRYMTRGGRTWFMRNAWRQLAYAYAGENGITKEIMYQVMTSQPAARTIAMRLLDEENKLVARDDYRISICGYYIGRYHAPLITPFDISEADIKRYYKDKALKRRGL